jgi:ribonuclease HI
MNSPQSPSNEVLEVFTDGGSRGNPGPAAVGVTISRAGKEVDTISEYLGVFTNNEAEYTAFQKSLERVGERAKTTPISEIKWFLDSMLVVEQLNKKWKIKEPRLQQFAMTIWQKLAELNTKFTISYVPRAQNARADQLVNMALDAEALKNKKL